jgi:hypothetical protein
MGAIPEPFSLFGVNARTRQVHQCRMVELKLAAATEPSFRGRDLTMIAINV